MLGERHLYCDGKASLLFTENETNNQRLFGGENRTPFVKDGINNYIVHGQTEAVNPAADRHEGRRALSPDRARREMRDRPAAVDDVAPAKLAQAYGKGGGAFGKHFDEVMRARRKEADEFYATRHSAVRLMRTPPTSCARRWPGCCGPNSFITST